MAFVEQITGAWMRRLAIAAIATLPSLIGVAEAGRAAKILDKTAAAAAA